ncbi:hypothetical protein [Pseudonocardia sp. N23]|uniref:hypothetical protein n=1 Tax=Pseudonocardia sp. N23 TaxID=1987376 RepID=UPI000BFC9ACD|nr:hypothetical protein [Pseudonocardia sp. N23]GAY10329.1 hypothetical protein TOK_4689 [Pseudonocardia sp. N23]
MTTAAPEQTITERLVSALTAAWRAIQGEHPEVPDVVLTLGSGTLGKRGGETTLGHFAAGRWQLADAGEGDQGLHELFVSGEGLRRGAAEVLATLLHEAAHGLAAARGVVDTSRQGRYHNKRFKALGEELGLVITEAGTLGWSGTALGPQAQERYADVLDQLAAAMTAFRRAEVAGLPGKSKSKNLLVAECACPRKIRVARSTLDVAPITCGACGKQFTAPDDDEDGAEDSADE